MTMPDPWADDLRGADRRPEPGSDDWRSKATPDDDGLADPPVDAVDPGLDGFAATGPVPPADAVDAVGTVDAVGEGVARTRKKAATKRKRPFSRVAAEYGVLAVFAIVLAFLIRTFVGLAFYIPSESMVPTLKVHDRVIVTRVSYHLHDPRRGDVVVFDNPNYDEKKESLPGRILRDALEVVGVNQPKDKNLIKRIVGLPGETVEGRDGHVFVNGEQLAESYLPAGIRTSDFGPVAIPKGRLWVMGDNRPNSADSRYFGTIARSSIVGRAFVRIWPPWRLGLL